MKYYQFGCVALLLFLPFQGLDARTIKVATIDYEPFSSPRMKGGGAQTALIRAAFKAVGHDVKFNFFPWKRALSSTIAGRHDFITSIYYTQERDEKLHFSNPLYNSGVGFIGLDSFEKNEYNHLKDLQFYNIGILNGAVYQDEFDRADFLQKRIVSSDDLNIPKLFSGRIDLVATSLISFQYKVGVSAKYDPARLKVLTPLLNVRPVYVAASRQIDDHGLLVEDFNRGLKRIIDRGIFKKIVDGFGLSYMNGDGIK